MCGGCGSPAMNRGSNFSSSRRDSAGASDRDASPMSRFQRRGSAIGFAQGGQKLVKFQEVLDALVSASFSHAGQDFTRPSDELLAKLHVDTSVHHDHQEQGAKQGDIKRELYLQGRLTKQQVAKFESDTSKLYAMQLCGEIYRECLARREKILGKMAVRAERKARAAKAAGARAAKERAEQPAEEAAWSLGWKAWEPSGKGDNGPRANAPSSATAKRWLSGDEPSSNEAEVGALPLSQSPIKKPGALEAVTGAAEVATATAAAVAGALTAAVAKATTVACENNEQPDEMASLALATPASSAGAAPTMTSSDSPAICTPVQTMVPAGLDSSRWTNQQLKSRNAALKAQLEAETQMAFDLQAKISIMTNSHDR
eukprot:4568261-Prymnesium_polylepis.1